MTEEKIRLAPGAHGRGPAVEDFRVRIAEAVRRELDQAPAVPVLQADAQWGEYQMLA